MPGGHMPPRLRLAFTATAAMRHGRPSGRERQHSDSLLPTNALMNKVASMKDAFRQRSTRAPAQSVRLLGRFVVIGYCGKPAQRL